MSINKAQDILPEMKCQPRDISDDQIVEPISTNFGGSSQAWSQFMINQDDNGKLIECLHKQGEEIAAKDRELEMLREQLDDANREIQTAQIAITVRHEINNPLTSILGQTQLLLLRRGALTDDVAKRLETIEQLSMRIRDIVKKLEVIKPIEED
ncbi:MAG TPA: histidine kinase dimerization/phospho-acceptor domain-containing protein [Blastocatellia bacterium]|nr:histidine kinase dimerization/phospho-acceptor domain-containing protein [Blastocatellia bacterium]